MRRTIAGTVIVITGASAGIGRALAVELSARGAKLALAARRTDLLEALNAELGGSHLCITTDVALREECERLIARTAEHFGRIDTLVCNAGYGFLRPVTESPPEMVRQIFQTNVFGTLDCIRAAVPIMLKQQPDAGWRGQVMMVSSAVARRAIPFFGVYSATKAAQLSLAEAMRVELAPQQIAVTSVHPIGTNTDFGNVSATRSGGKRPTRISGEVSQSAETVAKKMVRAIERPRPEVWPAAPSRWLLGLATLAPALADRALSKRREQIGGSGTV